MDIKSLTEKMIKNLSKSDGVFCQYRPCRRDVYTIYDIENIKNGVVYAQTPLNMNDPFDSMIGYSSDKIYDDCIKMIVDELTQDENIKVVVFSILKYKFIGKFAGFIKDLKALKEYYQNKKNKIKKNNIADAIYIKRNVDSLYSGRPKFSSIKFTKTTFLLFLFLVSEIDNDDISEEKLVNMFKLNSILDELHSIIENMKEKYLEEMKKFLLKVKISCFTNSGWNNQLMWSHYANSYSGICIEYDFKRIKDLPGYILKVDYSKERPVLSLSDIGISKINITKNDVSIVNNDFNMGNILDYLSKKNDCWKYENEWRIINVGEDEKAMFFEVPTIKSITFGHRIDNICKHLLYDVCKEKKINCFELMINSDNYEIARRKITDDDFMYDINEEAKYIELLMGQVVDLSNKIDTISTKIPDDLKSGDFDSLAYMLELLLSTMSNLYFCKISINRIFNSDEAIVLKEDNSFINGILNMEHLFTEVDSLINNDYISSLLSIVSYKLMRQIINVKELLEKYNAINWNENILDKINK